MATTRARTGPLLAVIATACATRDPCLEAHRQVVVSPSGSRRVNISAGPCPGAAPQILIEFDRGAGGAGVFAVDDSVLAARARWISEDTVEITYPANARVVKRESRAQYGSAHVTILYAVRADSTK
jgi:hypothetical protein